MLNQSLIPEFQHEAASTKKILERIPDDKFDWKPHNKSMTLGRLASHIAEIPDWMTVTLTTNELDFAKGDYKFTLPANREELLAKFQNSYEKALEQLKATTDENLMGKWTLRNGDHVIFTMPRIATLRSFVMNHVIHHRG